MKNIIIFAGIGLVLIGANIAGTYLIVSGANKAPAVDATAADGAHEEAAAVAEPVEKKGAIYFTVYPGFVVNILGEGGKPKFMQADLSVMAHDQKVIDAFELHMPAIRNSLIMLFAGANYEELSTPVGKENLRLASLETIRVSMEKSYGGPSIEDVFFTKLVIQ